MAGNAIAPSERRFEFEQHQRLAMATEAIGKIATGFNGMFSHNPVNSGSRKGDRGVDNIAGDELLALIMSVAISGYFWPLFLSRLFYFRPGFRAPRQFLFAACAASFLILYFMLRVMSSSDVRDSTLYCWMYMAMGGAWVGLAMEAIPFFCGISFRDDVLERSNGSAAAVYAGAVLGIGFCYAGSNIGEGPSWMVVVYCSGLATGALFLLAWLVDFASRISDAVTIDRDLASGIRFGAFLIAIGAILGRSAAGDWISAGEAAGTIVRLGWPAGVLCALEALFAIFFAPSPNSPKRSVVACGIIPASIYLLAAAFCIQTYGAVQ